MRNFVILRSILKKIGLIGQNKKKKIPKINLNENFKKFTENFMLILFLTFNFPKPSILFYNF